KGWGKMKKRIIFMLLVVFMLLAACSKADEKPEKSRQSISQLTGIAGNENIDDRIVGFMVNNHPKARPQSGLSKADIVFEVLAEGKITRFLALFQSEKPDMVGPVRSAREYYFELANGY